MSSARPGLDVAVVMRKERIDNRWEPWRWVLAEVIEQEESFGTEPRLLLKNEHEERWLHPGFRVELFRDDAEGYYLNATSGAPCWFVLWRMDDDGSGADEPLARPAMVSVSYHDAGRWMDAQEKVDQVPAPPEVAQWMAAFAAEHMVAEPKRRQRPESFKPLSDRFGNPASVSTGKKYGGGGRE